MSWPPSRQWSAGPSPFPSAISGLCGPQTRPSGCEGRNQMRGLPSRPHAPESRRPLRGGPRPWAFRGDVGEVASARGFRPAELRPWRLPVSLRPRPDVQPPPGPGGLRVARAVPTPPSAVTAVRSPRSGAGRAPAARAAASRPPAPTGTPSGASPRPGSHTQPRWRRSPLPVALMDASPAPEQPGVAVALISSAHPPRVTGSWGQTGHHIQQ